MNLFTLIVICMKVIDMIKIEVKQIDKACFYLRKKVQNGGVDPEFKDDHVSSSKWSE